MNKYRSQYESDNNSDSRPKNAMTDEKLNVTDET